MKPKVKGDENFEACRDLSGRRLRTVQNEQRLREYQERLQQEEKYVEEELREYNKNKAALKSAISANNYKLDDAYKNRVDQSTQGMEQAVRAGLKLNKKRREAQDTEERVLPSSGKKELNIVVKETLVGVKRAGPEQNQDDIEEFLGKLKRPKTQLH